MIAESTQPGTLLDETTKRVSEIIIDELKLDDVTPSTFDPNLDLIDELGIDSMDLTAVVLVLQDEYEITIYEEDYPELKTVGSIAAYVVKRRSA